MFIKIRLNLNNSNNNDITTSLNSTLDLLTNVGKGQKAIQLFQEMSLSKLVNPTIVSYIAVINACKTIGHWEEAMKFFKEGKKKYIECNNYCYNNDHHLEDPSSW